MLNIIGLGHYSRVGKDTTANHIKTLCDGAGIPCEIRSLAYKLKAIAHDLYGWAGLREPEYYETPEGAKERDVPLTDLKSAIFPDGPTPVQVWVAIGSPAIRDCVYPDTWIREVLSHAPEGGVLVIPDVRFPNEFETLLHQGGTLVKVTRPGFVPRETVADQALLREDRWHHTVENTGDEADLLPKAQQILESMGVLNVSKQQI